MALGSMWPPRPHLGRDAVHAQGVPLSGIRLPWGCRSGRRASQTTSQRHPSGLSPAAQCHLTMAFLCTCHRLAVTCVWRVQRVLAWACIEPLLPERSQRELWTRLRAASLVPSPRHLFSPISCSATWDTGFHGDLVGSVTQLSLLQTREPSEPVRAQRGPGSREVAVSHTVSKTVTGEVVSGARRCLGPRGCRTAGGSAVTSPRRCTRHKAGFEPGPPGTGRPRLPAAACAPPPWVTVSSGPSGLWSAIQHRRVREQRDTLSVGRACFACLCSWGVCPRNVKLSALVMVSEQTANTGYKRP